jgi:2-dehydropantoate 2-reductase
VAEGKAVFAAAGIEHASVAEQAARRGDLVQVQPVEGMERGGGSSWQSLARGTGSIEADYLNGEIVLLGRIHGVKTPVNDIVRRVANEFAREGTAPGSMTALELTALIDA